MKDKLSKFSQWLFSAIITLLGFTSTSCFTVAYGSPTSDYQAEGRITDQEGYPIKGIEVKAKFSDGETSDTPAVYSDEDGTFITDKYRDRYIVSLTATDIDGEKNGGEFETKEIDLTKMKPDIQKSKKNEWYSLNLYKDVEIKLTEKRTGEE